MFYLFTFPILMYLSTLQWQIGFSQRRNLQSEVRITKASNCNMTELKWNLQNISISYLYPKSFINAVLNITEETKNMKKMIVHLDRCIDQGSDCEDFQTWNFDNFCPMLNWKNQMWNGLFDSIRPKFRCPIKKMLYQAKNATYDFGAVSKWYPDFAKYYWKTNTKILNERDELVFCCVMESHVYQYRKRIRKS